jgi:hypothetical protein
MIDEVYQAWATNLGCPAWVKRAADDALAFLIPGTDGLPRLNALRLKEAWLAVSPLAQHLQRRPR